MPKVFGKEFTKQELLRRIGDISQIAGVQHVKLVGGMKDGVEAVEFRTGTGFRFLTVPGRGLDISIAEHNGRSLAWRSAGGEIASSYYDNRGFNWVRSFPGGLLTTCGLTSAGDPCTDAGEEVGLHGRISHTPADNLCMDAGWIGDDYRMWVSGKMREFSLNGENMVLSRKISTVLGENRLWIDDIVTNEGPRTSPHMILYHINGGFPAVDGGSQMVSTSKSLIPRTADAEVDMEHYYLNEAPIDAYKDRVYFHEMGTASDGNVYVALINKNMPCGEQFGFYVKYRNEELPKFVQWKRNGTQEYVVGIEPSNCWVNGRDKEREQGTLQFLEPGESREYHLEIGVLSTPDEVAEFERLVGWNK